MHTEARARAHAYIHTDRLHAVITPWIKNKKEIRDTRGSRNVHRYA